MFKMPKALAHKGELQRRCCIQILYAFSKRSLAKEGINYKKPSLNWKCATCLGNRGAPYLGIPSLQDSRVAMKIAIQKNIAYKEA